MYIPTEVRIVPSRMNVSERDSSVQESSTETTVPHTSHHFSQHDMGTTTEQSMILALNPGGDE